MEDLAVLAEVVVSHLTEFKQEKKGPYKEHHTTWRMSFEIGANFATEEKRTDLEDEERDVESNLEEMEPGPSFVKESRHIAHSINDLPNLIQGKVAPYLSSMGPTVGEKMPMIPVSILQVLDRFPGREGDRASRAGGQAHCRWHKTWRPEGIRSELFPYLQEKLNSQAKRVTLIVNPRFSEPASLLIRRHTNKIKKLLIRKPLFQPSD